MQSAQSDYRNQLGLKIERRVHGGVVNHITEPTMNTKQTALAAYIARTAAIHAKLERLRQLANDDFGHDPEAIHWGHVGDLGRVEAVLYDIDIPDADEEGDEESLVDANPHSKAVVPDATCQRQQACQPIIRGFAARCVRQNNMRA